MRLPFFIGGSYVSRSPIADPEDCINWFLEVMEAPGAKAKVVHYPTPGFTSYCTQWVNPAVGPANDIAGPSRGMLTADVASAITGTSTTCFSVANDLVYILPATAGGTASLISRLGPVAKPITVSSAPASFAYSGLVGGQLGIASGGTFYYADYAGGTWTWNLLGPVLPAVTVLQIGFLDSFFLALDTTSTLRISDSFDATTWDATQIVTRTAQADPWVALTVIHGDIWLFGTRTTDVYYNAGTSPFPFRPRDEVRIQIGIAAPASVAEMDNAPIWLGRSSAGAGVVFRAEGYTPRRVSDFAMEAAISRYTTIEDAQGFAFLDGGHWFYALTFPTAQASWLYDASNGIWVKVGYWNPRSGSYEPWRPAAHGFYNGAHLVGDRSSGAIYTMSQAVSTEMDGAGIRRLRRTPVLASEGVRLFFRGLQIDLETGMGLANGQGSAPELMIRWSDDGGKTWSNEHRMSAGSLGQYQTRAVLDRLGSSRARVFEVATSDPIPFRMVDAYLDVAKGRF